MKACYIDGGFDGGGLELTGFLRSSCEALLLVVTIYFQHVCIRIWPFKEFLTIASRDDKIGLIARLTRKDPP